MGSQHNDHRTALRLGCLIAMHATINMDRSLTYENFMALLPGRMIASLLLADWQVDSKIDSKLAL